MYLDFEVEIPNVPGKINYLKKGSTTYVRYVLGRVYHPEKKYNVPDQRIIGKRSEKNPDRMIPNENFIKYFGDREVPERKADQSKSSCLRIGTFLVIQKIIDEYKLPEILERYMGKKETGLLLDLAAYSIISENNAAQYYPSYAYNHPLFTKQMHIYSDSRISVRTRQCHLARCSIFCSGNRMMPQNRDIYSCTV